MSKFTQEKETTFNSSITFLDRINLWMERSHLYSSDDADIMDAFMALEEISSEIITLLPSDQRTELEALRKTTKITLLKMTERGENIYSLREPFRTFQIYLYDIIQSRGLLLKLEDVYDPDGDEEI